MTEIGKRFAYTAQAVVNHYKGGFGSTKMVVGYAVMVDDESRTYNGTDADVAQYEQLVKMGYLRKFVGNERVSNKTRNWRYRFMVKDVYFGLTEKGWEVAPQYIKVLEQEQAHERFDAKAKVYCERVKSTNPISYEEAYALAKQGVL